MANTATATVKGRFIEITFAGSGAAFDFMSDASMPAELVNLGQLKVNSISATLSAVADKIVITETNGGPQLFNFTGIAGNSDMNNTRTYGDGGTWMRPYFDLSKSSLSAASNAKIIMELA